MLRLSRISVLLNRFENRGLRANSLYRVSEQSLDTESHTNRRLDSEVHLSKQNINIVQYRTRRHNSQTRFEEQLGTYEIVGLGAKIPK